MTRAKGETATTTKAVAKSQAKEPIMYVGPTVAGLGIQNQVYTEIPKVAQEIIGETPELNNLFSPIR